MSIESTFPQSSSSSTNRLRFSENCSSERLFDETHQLLEKLKSYQNIRSEFLLNSDKELREHRLNNDYFRLPELIKAEKIKILKKLAKRDPEQYLQIFMNTLIENTTPNLYKISPKNNTAIHYAIKHNDQGSLDLLRTQFPTQVQCDIESGKRTPLSYALSLPNRIDLAKKLVEFGTNINFYPATKRPLLLEVICVAKDHLYDSLRFILSIPTLDYKVQDYEGRNVLHFATGLGEKQHVLDLILENPIFRELIDVRDIYGHLPIDYAYFYKNDRMIEWIEGTAEINRSDPRYGKRPISIHQGLLINQAIKFIQVTHHDPDSKLLEAIEKGICYGLNFLFFYYFAKEKTDIFYEIMETLNGWDGTEEALTHPFESSKLEGFYHNLADLFNQTINNVVWLQGSYVKTEENDPLLVNTRKVRYSLIRNQEKDPIFEKLIDTYYAHVSKIQLQEILEIFALHPNLMIDLNGSGHSVGIMTLPNGMLRLYDSNQKFPIPDFDKIEDLVQLIEILKYKRMDKLSGTGLMTVEIQVFKVGSEPLASVASEQIMPYLNKVSPNGFTPLHFAVMFNHRPLFEQTMSENSNLVSQEDKQLFTPLEYAAIMNRTDLFVQMISVTRQRKLAYWLLNFPCENDNVEIVSAYITKRKGYLESTLSNCAKYRSLKIAEMIFERADFLDLDRLSWYGILDIALDKDDLEMARLFLKNGVWPTKKFYRWIKLNIEKKPQLVEETIRLMPCIDIPSHKFEGENLLSMACKDNAEDIVLLLKANGALTEVKTKKFIL